MPTFADLEVFLQLLPRSSTGERMNPYTSLWTGVTAGDGPQEFHVVLLDNGRTRVLADEVGRQALHCIRCSACLNVCPVYSRTGGHAYGSVYPGPIGAILTPQLRGIEHAASLPFASTLCGACYEVCPVKIDIPTRAAAPPREGRRGAGRRAASARRCGASAASSASARRFELAQRLGRLAQRPFVQARRSGGCPARSPAGRDARPAADRRARASATGGDAVSAAREAILARGSRGDRRRRRRNRSQRAYRRPGALDAEARVDLLVERIGGLPRDRSARRPRARSGRRGLRARRRSRVVPPGCRPSGGRPGRPSRITG